MRTSIHSFKCGICGDRRQRAFTLSAQRLLAKFTWRCRLFPPPFFCRTILTQTCTLLFPFSAPQVGIDESILVYNIFGRPLQFFATENVLINPKILSSSKLTWTMPEGCLSLKVNQHPCTCMHKSINLYCAHHHLLSVSFSLLSLSLSPSLPPFLSFSFSFFLSRLSPLSLPVLPKYKSTQCLNSCCSVDREK